MGETPTYRLMTHAEQQLAKALARCTFIPASFDKRFAKDIRARAEMEPPTITEKQAALMREKVRRYRRQIPAEDVPEDERYLIEKRPSYVDLPKCPKCGGPSVPSERALRGDERPRGQLGCMACGDTWVGTPRQLEKAWAAEKAWERHEDREAAGAKHRAKVAVDQAKLARAMEGKW
jgi:hypothetical protein